MRSQMIFFLYESHNQSRFLDVAFNSDNYIKSALVDEVQQWLKTMKEDWMVSMWQACFLLITKDEILGFDPTMEDSSFEKLM